MIAIRFRTYDIDEWTEVTMEGRLAEGAVNVLSTWALTHDFELEQENEDGEWESVSGVD